MNIKDNKGFGALTYSMLALSAITVLISSFTAWYLAIHKETEKNGIYPTGMAVAQDRINDILNKNFYDNYQKAQNNETDTHITKDDGSIIYPGDIYDVETSYNDATTCFDGTENQLCYRVTVHVKNKSDGKIIASSNENVFETKSGRGIPIGTVIAYTGDLSKIPYGWELYSDMNGYFSKGTRTNEELGEHGGQKELILKPEYMPPHEFTFSFDRLMADGAYSPLMESPYLTHFGNISEGSPVGKIDMHSCPSYGYGCGTDRFVQFGNLDFSVYVNEWKSAPIPSEPEYYTVAYIIKTKEVN